MTIFSFISNEKKDFLRRDDGSVIVLAAESFAHAILWLNEYTDKHGYKRSDLEVFDWADRFDENLKLYD